MFLKISLKTGYVLRECVLKSTRKYCLFWHAIFSESMTNRRIGVIQLSIIRKITLNKRRKSYLILGRDREYLKRKVILYNNAEQNGL